MKAKEYSELVSKFGPDNVQTYDSEMSETDLEQELTRLLDKKEVSLDQALAELKE